MDDRHTIIKTIIESLLEKMNVEGFVEFIDDPDIQKFTIKTNEAYLLIGENGQNLAALNIILKKIVSKKLDDKNPLYFILDVNCYQEKKINDIKNIAKTGAYKARFLKEEIFLNPMNAYERRIVHTELAGYPDIKTESVGEENNRKIVIKPIN